MLFLSCVCVSVSGVLFFVGVCVCVWPVDLFTRRHKAGGGCPSEGGDDDFDY